VPASERQRRSLARLSSYSATFVAQSRATRLVDCRSPCYDFFSPGWLRAMSGSSSRRGAC
jgi:hypothetical protein